VGKEGREGGAGARRESGEDKRRYERMVFVVGKEIGGEKGTRGGRRPGEEGAA